MVSYNLLLLPFRLILNLEIICGIKRFRLVILYLIFFEFFLHSRNFFFIQNTVSIQIKFVEQSFNLKVSMTQSFNIKKVRKVTMETGNHIV